MTKASQLKQLMKRERVVELSSLSKRVAGRSYRSIHRYLSEIDYITSFTHRNRYYALRSSANFNEEGLWHCAEVGFSKYGTLIATVEELVCKSDQGYTHGELKKKLRVRVHNTLLLLTRAGRIGREVTGKKYMYLSPDSKRQSEQLREREQTRQEHIEDWLAVQILAEIIRVYGVARLVDPGFVVVGLQDRGVLVRPSQVEYILKKYGLKKTVD